METKVQIMCKLCCFVFVTLIGFVEPISAYCQRMTTKKSVPQVECGIQQLNQEIVHFLENVSLGKSDETCYWNMLPNPDSFAELGYFICQAQDNIPYKGNAYLQFGNNIVVIQGKIERNVFKRVSNSCKILEMRQSRANCICCPFVEINLYMDSSTAALFVKSNCEFPEYVDSLSNNMANEKDDGPFVGVGKSDNNVYEVRKLQQVECVNDVLDKEIKHYLNQCPSPKDKTICWNIRIWRESYTYCGSPVYRCVISLEPDGPENGNAYLLSDNNILVLVGHVDESLFKSVRGAPKSIRVVIERNDIFSHSYPYACFWFSKTQILKKYSHAQRLRNYHLEDNIVEEYD